MRVIANYFGAFKIVMDKTYNISDIIEYLVVFIDEFATFRQMRDVDACNYLQRFGMLAFLEDFYDVAHTLSLQDVVKMVDIKCKTVEKEVH